METVSHEAFMKRCIELAKLGFGAVQPNPMVGAVIVQDGRIVSEGYHAGYGRPHAEVEAIRGVKDWNLLSGATIYVNLEPCSHTGKTPPCTEAILSTGIKRVVFGSIDPNPKVYGSGRARLVENGVEVIGPVLEKESRALNRRFFTFHEKKRPFVILKWAETSDRFIAKSDYSSKWISSDESRRLVHVWRSQEMGVLVGTGTAIQDNPHLTVRSAQGENPVRVVIDRSLKIPTSFHLFDESALTLLFNEQENYEYPAATLIKIDFSAPILPQIMDELYRRGIQSLIVEGGLKTIQSFLDEQLWDEARVFTAAHSFGSGIRAPTFDRDRFRHSTMYCSEDTLRIYSSAD